MYGLIYMWNLKTKTKTKTPQKQKVDLSLLGWKYGCRGNG